MKSYAAIPTSLCTLRQWLIWRGQPRPGKPGKLDKLPHYAGGGPRRGEQGSMEDRAGLGSFEQALEAVARDSFSGIGIAMLADANLVGLDFDGCIDDRGEVAGDVLELIRGTYAERSPSKRGVRAFYRGALSDFKNILEGVEVFHAKGFLTVTGDALPGAAGEIIPLPDSVRKTLETLRPANAGGVYPEGGDRDPPYLATDIGEPTLTHLKLALAFLPSDDRDLWVTFARALKPLGALGQELWVAWSKNSPKYDPKDAQRVWRSIKTSRIGYKVVFAAANRAGWPGPSALASAALSTGGAERLPKPARELMARTFAPPCWTIADLLPEGCYLLAARPKIGKSWMALQFAVAVTEGGFTLSRQAARGAVLFLALEDNERRLQTRFTKHELGRFGDVNLFDYDTEWAHMGEGGEVALEAWLQAHPDARLIIIDTLERIRPRRIRNGSVYADDYAATQALKALSDKYKVTILIVAHNKKGKAESGDPLELISGSLGLSGGCDGALVIERPRGSPNAKFYVMGRDIEKEPDDGYVIRFDKATCKWEMIGDAVALADSAAQQSVMDAIRQAGHPLTADQIGKATHRGRQAARHILNRLVNAGKVVEIDGRPLQYDLPATSASRDEGKGGDHAR